MDALVLDAAMAYKFKYRDFDLTNERLHSLIDTIQMGFTAQGGRRPKKGKKPLKVTREDNAKDIDDLPTEEMIIAQALTGNGTVVVENE